MMTRYALILTCLLGPGCTALDVQDRAAAGAAGEGCFVEAKRCSDITVLSGTAAVVGAAESQGTLVIVEPMQLKPGE